MPVDAFIWFDPGSSGAAQPKGETRDSYFKNYNAFEILDFSFDIENKTSMGSATGGAGGGKAAFGAFQIKKKTDTASPIFFKNMVTGTHYNEVTLSIRKAGGDQQKSGLPYLAYTFKTVFTTKIGWSGPGDDFGPDENIQFAYGALKVQYRKQNTDGSMGSIIETMWSQVLNQAVFSTS